MSSIKNCHRGSSWGGFIVLKYHLELELFKMPHKTRALEVWGSCVHSTQVYRTWVLCVFLALFTQLKLCTSNIDPHPLIFCASVFLLIFLFLDALSRIQFSSYFWYINHIVQGSFKCDWYIMKLQRYPLFCEVSFQHSWKAFCFNFSLFYIFLNMP